MDFLTHLADDSARFRAALTDVDPQRPVPSCEGWTAADLLWHLTEVQWFWGAVVEGRLLAPPPDADAPARPTNPAASLALFEAQSSRLQDVLAAATGLDAVVWSWKDTAQPLRWVQRRQAHEALIHRVDAQLTADRMVEIDPAFASDGIAELLSEYIHGVPDWAAFDSDGSSVSIHATDSNSAWTLTLGRMTGTSVYSGTVYEGDAALDACEVRVPIITELADTVIRGRAADLDRWLWGRGPLTDLDITGEDALITRVRAMIADSTT